MNHHSGAVVEEPEQEHVQEHPPKVEEPEQEHPSEEEEEVSGLSSSRSNLQTHGVRFHYK
jgi:hypothetical protein